MVSHTYTNIIRRASSRFSKAIRWPGPARTKLLVPLFTPNPDYTYMSRNPHPLPHPHNLPVASLAAAGRNCRCNSAPRLSPTSRSLASPPRVDVPISGQGLDRVGSVVLGLDLVVAGHLTFRRRRRHRCQDHRFRDVHVSRRGLSLQYLGLEVARLNYPAVSSSATAVCTKGSEREGRTRSIGSPGSVHCPSSRYLSRLWP